MGGDWQQLLQSVFVGLIFSYLLAKLISIVISFKDDNLTITRHDTVSKSDDIGPVQESRVIDDSGGGRVDDEVEDSRVWEEGSVVAEKGSVDGDGNGGVDDDDDDDDDDWEGVESTELDEEFSAATAFVAAAAADRLSQKVSNDVQLQLYGLYKIATEGPCSTPQPSALKMTARAKWQAWQKLGAMPPEEAMQKYIFIVTELYPSWAAGSANSRGGSNDAPSTDAKGPMGPVFSTFVYEEESGNELKMDAIHAFAREGEVENLLKCVESGVSVNLKGSEVPIAELADSIFAGFKSGYLHQLEKIMEERIPGCAIKASPHIDSCVKTLKKQTMAIAEMFTHGSGFAWNEKK